MILSTWYRFRSTVPAFTGTGIASNLKQYLSDLTYGLCDVQRSHFRRVTAIPAAELAPLSCVVGVEERGVVLGSQNNFGNFTRDEVEMLHPLMGVKCPWIYFATPDRNYAHDMIDQT